MRRILLKIALVVLGLASVSGGVADQGKGRIGQGMAAAKGQVSLDSLVQQRSNGITRFWGLRQNLSAVGEASLPGGVVEEEWLDCPPMLELQLTNDVIAHHFDEGRHVTEVFVNENLYAMTKYEVDSGLGYTSVAIPVDSGLPWFAEDLDCDGEVELVLQFFEQLKIYSAPDWRLRRSFVFPGMSKVMYPVAVNIDEDPFLEIYVTPNTSGEDGLPTIIKYDAPSDSFQIIFQMWAPNGAIGQPAVGDFDGDGRIEFISGNNLRGGYELFEWQDSLLVHIGRVGDSLESGNFAAVACRPKPGGVLHALLGHSGDVSGFRYQLLEPTGHNTFVSVAIFQEFTPYLGLHPCWAADTDCDGSDELVMCFHPYYRVWEWDDVQGSFKEGCSWFEEQNGYPFWYSLDLDQNGAPEWGATNSNHVFRSFPGQTCEFCDASGLCSTTQECACACHGDPACDHVVNVLDVVTAVNHAFRSVPPEVDPFWQCPQITTDVDCDGDTDVLDVVHLVNVAFRDGNPVIEFCDPCP